MPKPLLFDSTPLIYLTRASLSKFLSDIPTEKITTQKVFNEVVEQGKKKGAPEASLLERLFKEQTIQLKSPANKGYLKLVLEIASENEKQPLHEAEAEVLCLAKECQGIAIADDKAVRAVARLLEIEVHGTGYLLGKLFMAKKLTKGELIEKIDEMRSAGWRVSPEDYLKITSYLMGL